MLPFNMSSLWSPRLRASAATYDQVCELMMSSRHTVVLTGAGVSTKSGIPDFRSPESGIWQHVDPFEVASIWGFRQAPERFYTWLRPLAQKMFKAVPNVAHQALADLERMKLIDLIITQNIDDLHRRAGSANVLHVHGSTEGAVCLSCGHREDRPDFWGAYMHSEATEPPRCVRCNSVLKPDVVLFGEELNHEELVAAQEAALNCDLMLAVGTSLEVMPAADLPLLAKRRGAHLVILNMSGTMADHRADLIIRDDVADSLPRLAAMCRQRNAQ